MQRGVPNDGVANCRRLPFHLGKRLEELWLYLIGEIAPESTDRIHSVRLAVPGNLFTKPHYGLTNPPGLHEHRLETDNVPCNAQPEQMRVDAFQLQHDRSDVPGPARRFDACSLFHGLAITCGMNEAANPAYSLGQEWDLVVSRSAVTQLFNASMVVKEAGIASHDRLAFDEQAPVGGFFQNRKERPHRQHACARGWFTQLRAYIFSTRRLIVVGEISPQGIHTFRPIVCQEQSAWIRMPFGMDANSIPEFPFCPICPRNDLGDRFNPQVFFGHGRFEQNVEMLRVERKQMHNREVAGYGSLVSSNRNHEARLQLVDQSLHDASHGRLLNRELEGIRVRYGRCQKSTVAARGNCFLNSRNVHLIWSTHAHLLSPSPTTGFQSLRWPQ